MSTSFYHSCVLMFNVSDVTFTFDPGLWGSNRYFGGWPLFMSLPGVKAQVPKQWAIPKTDSTVNYNCNSVSCKFKLTRICTM